MINNNPLLDFSGLPKFNDIQPQHIEPALDAILNQNRVVIQQIVQSSDNPCWKTLAQPLEEIADQLDKMWSSVSHLNSVKDSQLLRQAHERCLAKITDYSSELGQNARLFGKFLALKQSEQFDQLNKAQQKTINNELLDFQLSGVALNKTDKKKYKTLCSELSELTNNFAQNLLDATDAWSLHVQNKKDLAGLPTTVIAAAQAQARNEKKSGWLFNLQAPSYLPFMTYSDNAVLRKKMYKAFVTRASELGPNAGEFDNSDNIVQILTLRQSLAKLLGFEDYATYSMQTKMVETPEEVEDFLFELVDKSKSAAQAQWQAFRDFAKNHLGLDKVQAWDRAWASEKLRIHQYGISEETLRPYFPVNKVKQGLFKIVQRLFGITVKKQSLKHAWHDEVEFYSVTDENGNLRGYFYVDLFSREHKRSGAWMSDCIGRRNVDNAIQLPVAFLTCNFPSAVKDKPALLSHDDVITLFHEFGHGLHHILTQIDVAAVAGINGVAWDAVELPSQFLENWCWESEALSLISGHYQTNEPIPAVLLEKIKAARNFHSALQMQRQLVFSIFDLEIHRKSAKIEDISDIRQILQRTRIEVGALEEPEFNRFENSFGHIFAGGYAAGYYSYKWAEVLSADAYSLFEEKGLFDTKAGHSFMNNILEKGGSEEPMKLFKKFRGRAPDTEALLRHADLLNMK